MKTKKENGMKEAVLKIRTIKKHHRAHEVRWKMQGDGGKPPDHREKLPCDRTKFRFNQKRCTSRTATSDRAPSAMGEMAWPMHKCNRGDKDVAEE